jgi:hypothetical protein
MKEVNENENIMTQIAEVHSLSERSLCEIQRQIVEWLKFRKGSKHLSSEENANGIPFEGPPVQEKAYYIVVTMALS